QHEGTGLGLSICQRLVEMMGGRIWAESAVGHGATFLFTLVLERQTEQVPNQLLPPASLRGLKVLVIGNSATSCLLLHEILSGFGCSVTTTQSAVQGIALIEEAIDHRPYDLVLLDRMLPEMDGFEVAQKIRCHALIGKKAIPPKIILITMYDREGTTPALDDDTGGIDGYLLKPISSSGLFTAITEVFDHYHTLIPDSTEGARGSKSPDLKGLAGARILLVEDNEINQMFAVALLNIFEFQVDVAANGRIAVQQLKENISDSHSIYDAVLMDIEMPVMDGYTATRIIREDPLFKSLPIIAMTAHALKGIEGKCLEAGMNDYISKPIDEQLLCETLAKHIQPHSREVVSQPSPEQTITPDAWEEIPKDIPEINLRQALDRLGGSTGLLRNILRSFLEQFSDVEEKLNQLLTQGDMDQAERLIHAIIGTSGTIGAETLFTAARDLELQLRSKTGKRLRPAMDTFLKSHQRVIASLASLNLDQPLDSSGLLEADTCCPDEIITQRV
ncbi:MAG: response regulator, partial [Proteobacteria bacterium]|nr:response regulator [Pseudomonadota bacterium]